MRETSLQEIVDYLLGVLRYERIVDENGIERQWNRGIGRRALFKEE